MTACWCMEGILVAIKEKETEDEASDEYGAGYNLAKLKFFRKFYLEYPQLFTAGLLWDYRERKG